MDPVVWERALLECVARIADAEYQRRAWFGHGPEVSSPDEMFCELYDDLLFDRFLQQQQAFFSPEQLAAANRLKALLDAYDTSSPHLDAQRVIDDPDWELVRAAAREFMRLFTNQALDGSPRG